MQQMIRRMAKISKLEDNLSHSTSCGPSPRSISMPSSMSVLDHVLGATCASPSSLAKVMAASGQEQVVIASDHTAAT